MALSSGGAPRRFEKLRKASKSLFLSLRGPEILAFLIGFDLTGAKPSPTGGARCLDTDGAKS